jgi:hypothetical protein
MILLAVISFSIAGIAALFSCFAKFGMNFRHHASWLGPKVFGFSGGWGGQCNGIGPQPPNALPPTPTFCCAIAALYISWKSLTC